MSTKRGEFTKRLGLAWRGRPGCEFLHRPGAGMRRDESARKPTGGETPALRANAPECAERPGLAERCELGQLAVRKQPERRASPGRYVAADARLNAHFCGR